MQLVENVNTGQGGETAAAGRSGLEMDFGRLYDEHGAKIFNTVFCMTGNYQDAEEVFQDIFVRAYSALGRFRGGSELSTWLYSIAMNTTRGFLGRRGRRLKLTDSQSPEELEALGRLPGESNAVERGFERRELNLALRKALMNLPPDFREVFVLNKIDGYSYKEVAEILDISIGTVESRLFRAKDRLRRDLTGLSCDGSE